MLNSDETNKADLNFRDPSSRQTELGEHTESQGGPVADGVFNRGWSIRGLITLMFFRQLISIEEGVERTGRRGRARLSASRGSGKQHDELLQLSVCLLWLKVVTDVPNHLVPISPSFYCYPLSVIFPPHNCFLLPSPPPSSPRCFTGTDAGHWAPFYAGCPCSWAANQIALPELFTQVQRHTGTYLSLTHTLTHRNHTWAYLFAIWPTQLDSRNKPPHTIWSCVVASFLQHLVLKPSHH